MNHLATAGDERWALPRHAHVVVYERDRPEEGPDEGGLLTIYDCGAAQKPPTAQVIGRLVRVDASHEHTTTPTGAIVRMREESTLERQPVEDGPDGYVIRAR